MRVRRLPKDPGPAAWNELLPAAAPPTPLKGAEAADILIIGAGFAGLAAADRLLQLAPGARIIILDAVRVQRSSRASVRVAVTPRARIAAIVRSSASCGDDAAPTPAICSGR